MTWEEARLRSLEKWAQIGEMVRTGNRDPKVLAEEATTACGFCEKALEIQQEAEKKRLVQCPFCEGYIQYGGCRQPIDDLIMAMSESDWDRVLRQVDGIVSRLRDIELPQE